MRLAEFEIRAIKEAVYLEDENADIYIFGSRVDDDAKGGDIDILVISQKLLQKDSRRIKYNLYDKLGEQKIDIVIAKDDSYPFVSMVLEKGVLI